MFRDPAKLKVFTLADDLAQEVHGLVSGFPAEARPGLGAQLQRTALAVPLRIMEGCRRGGDEAFLQGLSAAAAAASDARYLASLAERLGLAPPGSAQPVQDRLQHLAMALYGLRKAVSKPRSEPAGKGEEG